MRRNIPQSLILLAFLTSPVTMTAAASEPARPFAIAADGGTPDQGAQDKKQPEPTPEEKMQARFPQPVRTGHLIGLPVLDGNDSTIGYVQQVVKGPGGKIKLIVPYAKRFGWARDGNWLASGRRPVAVPIETVAILALQINALDMERDAFDKASTWTPGDAQPIPPDEIIKIAVQRR